MFVELFAALPGGVPGKQKTRDCFGNRGFLENSMFLGLESSSHVAGKPGDAMPNGHLAAAAHGAQIGFKRGVHFSLSLTASFIRYSAVIVNLEAASMGRAFTPNGMG